MLPLVGMCGVMQLETVRLLLVKLIAYVHHLSLVHLHLSLDTSYCESGSSFVDQHFYNRPTLSTLEAPWFYRHFTEPEGGTI